MKMVRTQKIQRIPGIQKTEDPFSHEACRSRRHGAEIVAPVAERMHMATAGVPLFLAVLMLCFSLWGCAGGNGSTSSGEGMLSSQSSQDTQDSEAFEASSLVSSEAAPSSSLPESESGISSESEPSDFSGEGGDSSGNGNAQSSGSPASDSNAFEEKFAQNPLDAAYREASMASVSNKEMAELAETYAGYWEEEVNDGFERLLALSGNDGEIESSQDQWLSRRDQAMRDIAEEAAAAGGSMAAVEEATLRMEYYRTRAKEIYGQLYGYDPNFQFRFSQTAAG